MSQSKNSSLFMSSFEKMKDAVILHINKKKEQEKTNLSSHLANNGQSGYGTINSPNNKKNSMRQGLEK